MTQEQWETATKEEQFAEIEKCKDPVYFYNTYWVDKNGNKPKPMTKEQWDYLCSIRDNHISHRRYNRVYNTKIDMLKLPEFITPKTVYPTI